MCIRDSSYIKQVMAETGAVFGGEHSGHYYFADNFRADSGIIAAILVLELMSRNAKPLSELLAPFRRYADSGEINTEVADPASAVEAVAEHVADQGLSLIHIWWMWRSSMGSCWVTPSAIPVGRIVTLWTGSASSSTYASTAWPPSW